MFEKECYTKSKASEQAKGNSSELGRLVNYTNSYLATIGNYGTVDVAGIGLTAKSRRREQPGRRLAFRSI